MSSFDIDDPVGEVLRQLLFKRAATITSSPDMTIEVIDLSRTMREGVDDVLTWCMDSFPVTL
jgi:hypothetical protein